MEKVKDIPRERDTYSNRAAKANITKPMSERDANNIPVGHNKAELARVENTSRPILAKTTIDIAASTTIPAKITVDRSPPAEQRRGQNMLMTSYTKAVGINEEYTEVAAPVKTTIDISKDKLEASNISDTVQDKPKNKQKQSKSQLRLTASATNLKVTNLTNAVTNLTTADSELKESSLPHTSSKTTNDSSNSKEKRNNKEDTNDNGGGRNNKRN